ncbi:MAG: sulfatase-like hydrolase/transferase [bacterium]|nr:sulfatase-like hydrolase/transferase [bacterium]
MRAKRIAPVLAAVAAAAVIVFLLRRGGAGDRPNVLLITLDTTRADRLGCYGRRDAETPALDGLARSGVLFTRAFCNVPLTLPSHATIMTGLYPPEHGCRVNGAHGLPEGLPTLAETFSSRGYETAAFIAAFVLDAKFGVSRGFGTYDQFEVPNPEQIDENIMYRYRPADRVAGAALEWLAGHHARPFFCWVHFFDPHHPYYLLQPFMREARFRGRPYDAEIAFMDGQIARLVAFLRERGLLEKTIVVVVGDHGESLGEHGEDEHGLLLYNGVMRVPLIVSAPGRVEGGAESPALVSTVDIFPTVLDLLGWPLPGRVSGASFADALAGGSPPPRPFYSETEFPLTEYGWSPLQSITTDGWKFIDAPREELYEWGADPGEERNLAGERPEKARELRAALERLEAAMVKTEAAEVAMDDASRRILESLGYLGGGGAGAGDERQALRDPKDAVWMRSDFIKAVNELQAGRVEEGESILRGLVAESPESYAFRYRLARHLYEGGRFEEALPEFEEMARRSPGDFRSHYNLGKTLVKLGRFDRAAEELRASLALEPRRTDGLNNLGLALLGAGRLEEAAGVFRESISIDDRQCDPHNNLGNALLALGRTDEALASFRKSIEAKPDFFEGRFNAGLILLSKGRNEEAAKEFGEAVRLRPDHAAARRHLGIALMRAGRVPEGLKEFAVGSDPH